MSGDWNFGCLDRRQLHLRWFVPLTFCRWTSERSFQLDVPKLFNPGSWWRAARERHGWRFGFSGILRGCTCRCYCPDGLSIDFRIALAGWGLNAWYSHYWGDVPCQCEIAVAEYFEEHEEEEPVPPPIVLLSSDIDIVQLDPRLETQWILRPSRIARSMGYLDWVDQTLRAIKRRFGVSR